MSVKLIFWSQDPKNKNRNRHCWTFLCRTSRGRERAEERQLNGATERYGERQPQICCWMVLCCSPTLPLLPLLLFLLLVQLKFICLINFVGHLSLSLFLYCSTAERAESSAESEKHLIILFLCHSQCLQNSLCTEKWRRSQAEIETNQSGWQSFLFCFVLSCPLPNLYIVAAAVVSLFRSLYLCVCCEKL